MMSPTLYRIWQRMGRLLFSIYAPITVTGTEQVPHTGAFLLVSNHASNLDPPLIAITCPRRLAFFAKREVYKNPFLRLVARAYHTIPVDRENPSVSTVRKSIKVLRSGTPIMIAPEGTRSLDGTLQPFKPGFIKLAHRAGVPILPVGIVGTFEVLPRNRKFPRPGRIAVRYGPLYREFLNESADISDAGLAAHNEAVRSAVAELSVWAY